MSACNSLVLWRSCFCVLLQHHFYSISYFIYYKSLPANNPHTINTSHKPQTFITHWYLICLHYNLHPTLSLSLYLWSLWSLLSLDGASEQGAFAAEWVCSHGHNPSQCLLRSRFRRSIFDSHLIKFLTGESYLRRLWGPR